MATAHYTGNWACDTAQLQADKEDTAEWKKTKQNKTRKAQFGDSGQASEILRDDTSVMVATAVPSAAASWVSE